MSAIKDIIDLAKDLESRAHNRADIEVLNKIHSNLFTLQSQLADIMDRDFKLMEENAELKRQLSESQSEDIRIHLTIEFRRGKRTGGKWLAFCPKCHMPVIEHKKSSNERLICCTSTCGWLSPDFPFSLQSVVDSLNADVT